MIAMQPFHANAAIPGGRNSVTIERKRTKVIESGKALPWECSSECDGEHHLIGKCGPKF